MMMIIVIFILSTFNTFTTKLDTTLTFIPIIKINKLNVITSVGVGVCVQHGRQHAFFEISKLHIKYG